ncbi:MAG: hypothetical protein J2P24_16915 [Streptosporangiales bacterium]|nr:hypothetical protein [Streptosporangiales bacterium]MBO0892383.1 hypothetical protein [Acidothermales bacterium]
MTRSDAVPAVVAAARMPGHERLWRVFLAVAIVGGPLGVDVGGALAPSIHGNGRETIAANAAASAAVNDGHLVAFVVASFLLPVGALGLACLAYPRSPWPATIGGLLGFVGWVPYAALTALDDLARAMAGLPGSGSYATLLDRFTVDPTMNAYLLIYVACHLVAYVLLGVALCRARVIPVWAAVAMIASSPVTILAFALPGRVGGDRGGLVTLAIGCTALTLLVVGSLPAARAMLAGETSR